MKKIVLVLFSFLLYALLAATAATSVPVKSNSFKIISQHADYIDVEFTLPQYKISNEVIGNTTYQHYTSETEFTSIENGMPEFPIFSTMLAIPYRGNVDVEVLSQTNHSIPNQIPYPCQYKLETENSPKSFTKNTEYYQNGALFPAKAVNISSPQVIRDFRVISLSINPFSYNAQNQEVQVRKTISLRIHLLAGQGENEMEPPTQYSRSFDKIYESMILNYDNVRDTTIPLAPRTVLMIYPATTDINFNTALNNFAAWKTQKGFEVKLASTAITGTSNTAIKTYIQNAYSTWHSKPDFIILIGDVGGTYGIPTWSDTFSGYNGEGDYPYTHLSGGATDYLGDAFLGRISISNLSDFQTILAKVYAYEKSPNLTNPDWYNHLLLVGDPTSSGISTIYTNKFIKDVSYYHNPDYTYSEVYSGFSTGMTSGINQGSALFNYRGYISMSGWSPTSANLINGHKLPHAVIMTCSTGNFASNGTTEEFIRMGTATTLKGAITATGMCTSHTHTMLNNTLAGGTFDGIYTYDMHTMGEAVLNGKLYLNKLYGVSNTVLSNTFAHWCNLMGDPTVEIYTKIPEIFNVEAPAQIAIGTNYIDVNVTGINHQPIQNATVTLYQAANLALTGYTDALGNYRFDLPQTLTGTIILTTTKDNFAPTIQNIIIDGNGSLVFESAAIVDSNSGTTSGNGNGVADANETIAMTVHIKNTMNDLNPIVTGELTTTDPDITISSATSGFGTISAGTSSVNQLPFLIHIQNSVSDLHQARFNVVMQDNLMNNYTASFEINVRNSNLQAQAITVADEVNSILDPGETSNLLVTLRNSSSVPAIGITAALHSTNSLVTINDSLAVYGNIAAGASVTSNLDPFNITGKLQLIPGMIIPFELRITNSNGFAQVVNFNLSVGQVTIHDPLGPDEYGNLIYDIGDTAYPDCPQYDWIGIAPAEGGSGTLLAFNDNGSSGSEGDTNSAVTMIGVDIPFTFSFYGQLYNHMTVCSNGFISMGSSEDGDFRNYRLPGAMGPNPMIAAFWDDLQIHTGAGVYKYYDAAQHYMIIEWYHTVNGYNETSEETFQIILYDPSYYPTSLGDGQVKIQYKVINNVDVGSSGYTPTHGNYATVGIKDRTGKIGLEYTFDNGYPMAARQLSNESALFITGPPIFHAEPHILLNETVIHDANHNLTVEPGEIVEMGLRLSNMGESAATGVSATLSVTDQYVTMMEATSLYDPIAGESTGINKTYFRFQVAANTPNDHVITFTVNITANGYNWQRYATVRVSKAQLVYLDTFINDLLNGGNANGKADPDENVKLILNISNPGLVNAENVNVSLSCMNNEIIIADSTLNDFAIPVQKTVQKVFDVYFPATITPNTYVTFSYTINALNASPVTGTFSVGVSTSGLSLDFESNNGGFISSGGWAWGTPTPSNAHSGTKLWATALSGNYPDGAHYELTSTPITIGSNASLTFWHRYGFENSYDGGNIKVSTNNGQSFTIVTPVGGYNDDNISSLNEPGFTNMLDTWTQVNLSLSAFGGNQILIKWTMGSDTSVQNVGWFIDDVQISGFVTSTGIISGQIEYPPTITAITEALITAGNFNAHPDTDGSYSLYVQNGTYSLTIQMPYCQQIPSQNVTLSAGNQFVNQNFTLNYLVGPAITGSVLDNIVHLSWSAPVSTNTIQGYVIHRQIDADNYQIVTEIADTTFTDSLAIVGRYLYYVTVHYTEGQSAPSNIIVVNSNGTGTTEHNPVVPIAKLFNNYPNPFNPETHIAFSLAKNGTVSLKIYNIKGQLVKVLADGKFNAGHHSLVWNGKNDQNRSVSSGVYFYKIITPGFTDTKKAILLK